MITVKFLKDCKWCIDNKGVVFKNNEIYEVDGDIAVKMIVAKHAVQATPALSEEKKEEEAKKKAKKKENSNHKELSEKVEKDFKDKFGQK